MRKTQDRVIDFIAGHSRATRKRVTELMNCSDNMSNDVGTILFGKEAVDAGIIDAVGGVSQALGELRRRVAKVDELEKEISIIQQQDEAAEQIDNKRKTWYHLINRYMEYNSMKKGDTIWNILQSY